MGISKFIKSFIRFIRDTNKVEYFQYIEVNEKTEDKNHVLVMIRRSHFVRKYDRYSAVIMKKRVYRRVLQSNALISSPLNHGFIPFYFTHYSSKGVVEDRIFMQLIEEANRKFYKKYDVGFVDSDFINYIKSEIRDERLQDKNMKRSKKSAQS